jgi:hypothetical protein
MYASVKGYTEAVKWLTSKDDLKNASVAGLTMNDAKKNILRLEGLSAMYLAIMSEDMEIVKLLAESSLTWDDFIVKLMPGEKFESSFGSKGHVFNFVPSKKHALEYTPSLFADFTGQKEMAKYLSNKEL